VLLSDFGLSKTNHVKTQCGTSTYMAPEMFHDQYDYKVDCWAYGVCLYTMIQGHLPFGNQDDENLLDSIMNSELHFNPNWDHCSIQCKMVVKGLLERVVAKRLDSEQVLRHEWINKHIVILQKLYRKVVYMTIE
jgi:serine/threonine protein kinase